MRHGRIEAAEGRHFRTLFELGAAGTLSDGQLLERFATREGEGAELAFAALVERHGSLVLRVARSVLRDEASAHDAFQATFLILARKGPSLWVRDSIGPWLHAVAWRVASRARFAEARRRRSERSAARPESQARPDDRPELARVLHEEIARLPDPYRSAVVACHLEGLTHHDAARRLGWPVGTLQSRLDRARRKLRDRLARRGYAPTLILPFSPPIPVPNALILATSRLAVASSPATLAGPAVLALVGSATKGLSMTPWKIAATTLVMAGSLAASGFYLGESRAARATDGLVVEAPQAPAGLKLGGPAPSGPTKAGAEPKVADVDIHGFQYPAPASLLAAAGQTRTIEEPAIPPPADGPGRPALLAFYLSDSISATRSHEEIMVLASSGYPLKSMPIVDLQDEQARRHDIQGTPCFLLRDEAGVEIARHVGYWTPAELARFYNDHRPKAPSKPTEEAEPALMETSPPKPWETAVRIRLVISDREWGFGSGTIVRSTPEESIILTAAHAYRPKDGSALSPDQFRVPIMVDLFDGVLGGPRRSIVHCSERDLRGELIAVDSENDVALLRIRPGRVLPASPVVSTSWKPMAGMRMVALGCSHGNDATAWSTTILDPRVDMMKIRGNRLLFEMKCSHQPTEGRSGGGLYTQDGYVAGVCNFADPQDKSGLYAVPEAIHRLLDRNGLSAVFGGGPKVAQAVDPKRWEAQTFPYDNPYIKRLGTLPGGPARSEPKPAPAVSDTDRRLADLERKLDRVVEALDNLIVGKKLEGPIGDFEGRRGR